jgi:hypothetical protein
MTTFTLNAPGTTNNPWNPSNVLTFAGGLRTDASGIRGGFGTVGYGAMAHNASYSGLIDATVTIAVESGADEVGVAAVVRTGANAGASVGALLNSSGLLRFVKYDPSGTQTQIGSNQTVAAFTAGDTMRMTYNPSDGTITAYYKGSLVGSVTDSTYAAESSLAAGATFNWGNVGGTYISQFVAEGSGTGGVSGTLGATESGSDTFAASGSASSLGVRVTLRDTDTGALYTSLTGVIASARSSSNSATVLASTTTGTTDGSGVFQLQSGALGAIGTYVYLTVEKSDNSIVAAYRIQVIDLNA